MTHIKIYDIKTILKLGLLIALLIPNFSFGQSKTNRQEIRLYQVDAFTNNVFSGNPAAVCPLDQWLSDKVMQNIAMENNLSETAFYVKEADGYRIRWFTPTTEVDLCGHATLASAFVMFNYENVKGNSISFYSKSGMLTVSRNKDLLTLDFPVDSLVQIELTNDHKSCFGEKVVEVYQGKRGDYLFVFESEEQIRNYKPDLAKIAKIGGRGSIITAPGNKIDFVSRCFAPQHGIDEDPVTGSAHTTLVPYWFLKTGKKEFQAAQLSKRGGKLQCNLEGARVAISGKAKLFSQGTIFLD
jgi:PhzF family phenazine biosynthesis protein